MIKRTGRLLSLFFIALLPGFTNGCKSIQEEGAVKTGSYAAIAPDYVNVTIPPNIAPLNFMIREPGNSVKVIATSSKTGYQIKISSGDGVIQFPEKKWKKLIEESKGDSVIFRILSAPGESGTVTEFKPFAMYVSEDKIDPYLAYRLIHPGYYSWSEIKIMQRSLETFSEKSVFENQLMDKNCANCHSFNKTSADRFMIHIRGSLGGTYIADKGKITRTDPKIDEMPGSATYPNWHPDGRYIAFSSNQVRQSFYSVPEKSIEVFDLVSSLILLDREKNEIISINDKDTTAYLETFPGWSADGRYLYFCRAENNISMSEPTLEQIQSTHYDLARRSFDPETRTFGETELVFRASETKKSVSFPRISPDGKFLVFTLADYGTFPIWHREADLYMLNLETDSITKMDVNSNETESYHTFSLNGKWLVFSSKRIDTRTARPFFVHIDSDGKQGKEFVLPQEDPSRYDKMLESFNIPEFVDGEIGFNPRDFLAASKQDAIKTKSGNPARPAGENQTVKKQVIKEADRPIHE